MAGWYDLEGGDFDGDICVTIGTGTRGDEALVILTYYLSPPHLEEWGRRIYQTRDRVFTSLGEWEEPVVQIDDVDEYGEAVLLIQQESGPTVDVVAPLGEVLDFADKCLKMADTYSPNP